ncbi:phage tail tape measure protein [Streptomyces sp. AD55]|uniref:phage tail tape measure protein n=1 Tax=Streptomyces sp. AD55 TaxID=3242895 RepID=UPI00352903B2
MENDGSVSLRITLDESGTASQAQALGRRISRAIQQGTKGLSRELQNSLSRVKPKVRVAADMREFERSLKQATAQLKPVKVPVTANLTQFQRALRETTSGLKPVKVPVTANLTQFHQALREVASQLRPVRIPVSADLRQFQTGLRSVASQLRPVTIPVNADLRQFQRGMTQTGRARPVTVPIHGDSRAFRAGLTSLGNSLSPVKVPVRADLSGFKSAVLAAAAGAAAAVAGTVNLSASFESEMKKVLAVTQASGAEFKALEDMARQMGATTRYTATQAAEGMSFLGMTGFKTDQILQALPSTLDLAAAASMDLGRAADIVSNIMTGYGKQAHEVAGINDMLVKTFISSNVDVEMLGHSFKYVGGTAKASGLEMADTAAILGAMGDAGLQASMSGTGLRRVLARLQDPTKKALAIFEKYGVELKTSSGEMRPMIDILRDLAKAGLEGGDAIQAFGDRGGPAMGTITSQLPKIDQLRESLRDVDGVANEVATTMNDSAKGGFLMFQAAIESLAISIGQAGLLDAVKYVTSALTEMVTGIDEAAQSNLGGAFATVAKTVKEAFSAVSDTGIFDGLRSAMSGVWEVVQGLMPVLKGFGSTVGAALLVALMGAAQALNVLGAALQPLGAWLQANSGLVGAFGAALAGMWVAGKVAGAVTGIVGALRKLRGAMMAIRGAMLLINLAVSANPIGLIITAVVGLVAALIYLYKNVEPVRKVIDSTFSAISGFVAEVISVASELPGKIGEFFSGLWDSATAAVSAGIDAIVEFFIALPGRIVAAIVALPGLLYEAFTSAVAFLIIGLLTLVAGIVYVFTELPGKIWNALVGLGTWLIEAFVSAFNATTAKISEWVDAAVEFFRALPGKTRDALVSFGASLLASIASGVERARIAISEFVSNAVKFLSELPGKIWNVLSSLPEKLSGVFRTAKDRALVAVASMISGIAGLFRELPRKILSGLGNIGSDIMKKVTSGLPSSVRKYLPFAQGGIVYGPTHALIGEAGPEVVIPLSKPKRARQLAARSGLLGILGATAVQPRALAASARPSSAATTQAVSSLRGALAGIGSLLDNIGREVVNGMVLGMRSQSGRLEAAAADMAGITLTTAKDELGIASPSKKFAQVGKDVGRGFIEGLTGTTAKIKSTTEELVKSIQNAFGKSPVGDRLVRMLDSGNKRLTGLAEKRDALVKKIADAEKYAADSAKSAMDAFSLKNLTQETRGVNTDSLASKLRGAVSQMKGFTSQVDQLVKKGLRKDLLQQIIGAGPQEGAELARALASADKATIKRLNSLQAELSKSATRLGDVGADALYDAGAQAGKGLLAGLKAEKKSIEKFMVDIARSMQTSIRAALRIKSPSQVFRAIGEMTGAGLELGVLGRLSRLAAASRASAQALVRSVSSELSSLPDLSRIGSLAERRRHEAIPLTRYSAPAASTPQTGRRGAPAAGGPVFNNTFEIREVGDGRVTAQRVLTRLVHAAGMG